MKKLFTLLVWLTSTSVFAADATFGWSTWSGAGPGNGINTMANQQGPFTRFSDSISKNFSADVLMTGGQYNKPPVAGLSSDNANNGLSYAVQLGVTGKYPIKLPVLGDAKVYTRVGVGAIAVGPTQWYRYNIEPGIVFPIGNTETTAKFGVRYQDNFVAGNMWNKDTSKTIRVALSHPITKLDSIGVGYDRQRGDWSADIWSLALTHTFGNYSK